MTTELESLAEFDDHVARYDALTGCLLQSLDLRDRDSVLRRVDVAGAIFLGCHIHRHTEERLRAGDALLFPRLPAVPVNPYRRALYTPAELYDGLETGYEGTPDERAYRWFMTPPQGEDGGKTLAMALHDHAIDDALAETGTDFAPGDTVGVMGGHAIQRGSEEYARAAELGAALAGQGKLVVTGGGPGAMEAANLGARFSGDPAAFATALDLVGAVPSFVPDVAAWARTGFEARELVDPDMAGCTLGIPTWFYGHEPPNVFPAFVAKFFNNARREEVLLHRCTGGIVYLPGAAGTVQEIFQAVTGNYYAQPAVPVSPLVLLGHRYWTRDVPAWPLLKSLAAGRRMQRHIHLVDSVSEAMAALGLPYPATPPADNRRHLTNSLI